MRQTSAHKQIITLLSQSLSPLSASDLLSHITANKTTIYRQLSTLVKNGLVQEIHFSDRKIRYELKNRPHHHHLVCTTCDFVSDISLPHQLEDQVQTLASKTNFKIANHYLEFFGQCTNCQT